jgi:regulatory protein
MKALSLKMRAITLLAQREHSRIELRRKLLRIAREQVKAGREGDLPSAAASPAESDAEVDLTSEVDELLVWLQAQGYLSEARFVESRIHARAQRYGNLRIQQELAQHGLSLGADSQAQLKDSEFERALAIWRRKFGVTAEDAAGRAKQTRFLIGRGFSSEVIRRVLRQVLEAQER